MAVKFSNDASTTLTNALSDAATEFVGNSASSFPEVAEGQEDYTYLTLSTGDDAKKEIVKCTAIVGNTFTVERGAEETVPTSFDAGDRIEVRITAGLFTDAIENTGLVEAVALNTLKVSNVVHPLVQSAVPVGALFTDTDTVYDPTVLQGEVNVNTGKVGITAAQASAITANSAKETNSTNAGDLISGTLPDVVFPATLPAVSGANLTDLPAAGATTTAGLTDVSATPPSDGQVLTWDAASNRWEPTTSASSESYTYTATESQIVFTGADAEGASLAYTAGNTHVFLNGILLDAIDYDATDGATITLVVEATSGDTLQVVAYGVVVVAEAGESGGWKQISTASVTSSTSYIDFDGLDTTTYSEFRVVMTDVGASQSSHTTQKMVFSDTASISSNTSGGGTDWGKSSTYLRFTHYGEGAPYLYGDSQSDSSSSVNLYWRWQSGTSPYAQSNANNRLNGEYYINMQDDIMTCRGYLQGKYLGNAHGLVEWWHSLATGSNKPQSFRIGQSWNYSGTFTLYGR